MTTQQLTPQATQIYAGGQAEIVTLYNSDGVNSVTIGRRPSLAIGDPDADMLPPNGTVTYQGEDTLYAAAAVTTDPLTIAPGVDQLFVSTVQFGVNFNPFGGGNNVSFPPGATQTSTLFQVNQFASLFLRALPSQGFGQVSINWFGDALQQQPLGSDAWHISGVFSPPAGLLAVVPVKGQFCTVSVNTTGSVQALNVGTFAFMGSNIPVLNNVYAVGVNSTQMTAQSIPASTTKGFNTRFISKGTWYAYINPADALGKLRFDIVVFNPDGTVNKTVDTLGLPTANIRAFGGVVDDIFGVFVTNTDTVAHTFTGSITVSPLQ